VARLRSRSRPLLAAALLLVLAAWQVHTQSQVQATLTSPRQAFGAGIGDDYFLATYTQLEQYWKTLERESDRVTLVDIGRTEEGRTQWMAVVSAPENLRDLDRYRDISRRLALAEGLSDEEARALAGEGRAVVWIDGGIHANEVLGAQQLIETVYRLASRSDAETLRLLQDVIVLAVHANPDGHELVSDWYMREPDPRRRRLEHIPRAYQKYVGHDNNRDFFLSSQAETINMNRVLYREWFPQIVLNHHQTSPPGTVMFAPPFRPPFNYVFDPLIPVGIDLVGAAIHARFAAEQKPGVITRGGSNYSTWWNGGLRTSAYFHNQIGLLTETMGDPTPTAIPRVAERLLPSADLPFPIAPQPWRFQQSIEYVHTANMAVLDVASRFRETFLFNAYRMGRNSIDRGSRDTWTLTPSRVAALTEAVGARAGAPPASAGEAIRDSALRDPRGYILPADQPDFLTATKFVDALLKSGVQVHRATEAFSAGGRSYPAGSYVVRTAQAFRPHVLDLFEPQDHPDDVPHPGGAPTPPYDNAGWTLAYQMGVKFDRVLDAFTGPFEAITSVRPPAGRLVETAEPAGYLVSHHQNDAFVAVNRLLKGGDAVYWLLDRRAGGASDGTGVIYVPSSPTARAVMERAAATLGLTFTAVEAAPAGDALQLAPVRVGLWDRYGGSASSGWTRWMLERYEFPFEIVYAPALDAGNLASRFDVIILPDDAVPGRVGPRLPEPERVPPEYRPALGNLTWDRTVPQLRRFVEAGGTLLAIGGATTIAERLGVPVTSALTVRTPDGRSRPLDSTEFFVPGSVLRVRVDPATPLGFGFEREVDVFFDDSPAFWLAPGAAARGVRPVAWFASKTPLRSGWALGQHHLEGAVAALEAPVGRGRVLLFGPEIIYRAQSHGTFKVLFNGIHSARLVHTRLPAASR
jgi:hypothetical protein